MLLTRAECEKILENLLKSEGEKPAKLLDYHILAETNAIGYLGDYYALSLSYAGTKTALQRELFIKALPQLSDEPLKESIFTKEAWLYENVLAKMQKYSTLKWSVNCYYARPDLMVLENVKLSGFQVGTGTVLDESQLLQLLRSLASFHASSLIYEHKTATNIGIRFGEYLQEISVSPHISWFTTGLSAVLAVIKSLPEYQSVKYANFIEFQLPKILNGIYEQVGTSRKYRNVLCHRDTWAANIFFASKAQTAPILVDFQTARYCPAAVDLSLCMYMNLTKPERQRLEERCLEMYYNWLAEDLQHFGLEAAQALAKSELLECYEEFRLFGVVYRAVAVTVIKVPKAYVTNEFKYIERSAVILDYMKENAEFRACMRECCEEIMEKALSMALD